MVHLRPRLRHLEILDKPTDAHDRVIQPIKAKYLSLTNHSSLFLENDQTYEFEYLHSGSFYSLDVQIREDF